MDSYCALRVLAILPKLTNPHTEKQSGRIQYFYEPLESNQCRIYTDIFDSNLFLLHPSIF